MTGLQHAVLLLAIAVGTVRGQTENPPAPPVEDLPLTDLSDANFWVTTNQIWDETDSALQPLFCAQCFFFSFPKLN